MYELHRIVEHHIYQNDDHHLIRHDVIYSQDPIFISNDDMDFLIALSNNETEYSYMQTPLFNIIRLDRHPDSLAEEIFNEDFLKDYSEHLDERFFISYIYQEVI